MRPAWGFAGMTEMNTGMNAISHLYLYFVDIMAEHIVKITISVSPLFI